MDSNNNYYALLDELYNVFRDHPYEDGDEIMFDNDTTAFKTIVDENVRLFLQLRTRTMADLSKSKYEKAIIFIANLKENISVRNHFVDKINTTPRFAQLQPLFRNLGNLSESDRTSIAADAELLILLNDLEEEMENNSHE